VDACPFSVFDCFLYDGISLKIPVDGDRSTEEITDSQLLCTVVESGG
jgi:hypothetical protein